MENSIHQDVESIFAILNSIEAKIKHSNSGLISNNSANLSDSDSSELQTITGCSFDSIAIELLKKTDYPRYSFSNNKLIITKIRHTANEEFNTLINQKEFSDSVAFITEQSDDKGFYRNMLKAHVYLSTRKVSLVRNFLCDANLMQKTTRKKFFLENEKVFQKNCIRLWETLQIISQK